MAKSSAGPLCYRGPEALRCVINQEGPAGAGNHFQRDQVVRHPVKTCGDNTECLTEVESYKGIEVQAECFGVHITEPDQKPSPCHGRGNGKTCVGWDHYLSPI